MILEDPVDFSKGFWDVTFACEVALSECVKDKTPSPFGMAG